MSIDALRRYYGSTPVAPKVRVDRGKIEELIDGRVVSVASGGSCFVSETAQPADQPHGQHRMRDLATLVTGGLSVITRDHEVGYLDMSRCVFLDTETTGLGMGTGTYVFLVGAGYIDGSHFRVQQFFLRGPGDERAFLTVLQDFLIRFSAVVTFNGKAFDWPMIHGRYQFQFKRPPPLDGAPHLDLLHPARRLWKSRLESCALSSLERHILGVIRTEEDVPGWRIPSIYFDYQRTGDGRELRRVFYHNLHDVLSLAALTIHIEGQVSDPSAVAEAVDLMCVGRAHERSGDPHLAAWCYEEAIGRGLPDALRRDCLQMLAGLQKRLHWWADAHRTWERLIDEGGRLALLALVERAKYHEHVEREYDQAIEDVLQALVLVDVGNLVVEANPQANGSSPQELEHRLMRLYNRRAGKRPRSRM